MKAGPPDERAQDPSHWQAFIATFLVAIVSVVTVLGAIVLSLEGQAKPRQSAARQSGSTAGERIPTAAAATPVPITIIPSTPLADTVEPLDETEAAHATQLPSASPDPAVAIEVTPTPSHTSFPEPSATPWPCAGGAPIDWLLYIVQSGDTLFSLAGQHNTNMDDVIYYNCLTSDQLWAGQRLYLPASPTLVPSATAMATPAPSPTVTLTFTATVLPMPTATLSETLEPTLTAIPSLTFTPVVTTPVSPTATPTITPPTETPGTPSPRPTDSPTLTPTASPIPGSLSRPSGE